MKKFFSTHLLAIMVLLVVFVCVLAGLLIILSLPSWTERGQFGDLFGSVNALFSGLAFAGLFYTIYLQREELALQREELRLQREEMKASREQLEYQANSQRALFLATVGQIKVASIQATIESIKTDSEMSAFRGLYAEEIKGEAAKIEAIALEIETAANADSEVGRKSIIPSAA